MGFQLVNNYGKRDQPIQTKVIVTDVDGNLIDNVSIECKIVGIGAERKEDANGLTVSEEVKDEQQLTNASSKNDAVTMEFTPTLGKSNAASPLNCNNLQFLCNPRGSIQPIVYGQR